MSVFDDLRESGFVIVDEFLKSGEIDSIDQQLDVIGESGIDDKRFLDKEWCRVLSHVVRLRLLKQRLLYLASSPVLCTYFDKTPEANWGAQSGRDISIPVLQRVSGLNENEWTHWTERQSIPHVQPPPVISRQMLLVRLYLDDCDSSTGALKVAPGSHLHTDIVKPSVRCEASAGSALVLSPLLIRQPIKAAPPGERDCRVLQYLFGPNSLPHGVKWYYSGQ